MMDGETRQKHELYRTKVLAMLMHTQDSAFAKSGEFPDAPDLVAIFAFRMGAMGIFIQKYRRHCTARIRPIADRVALVCLLRLHIFTVWRWLHFILLLPELLIKPTLLDRACSLEELA